MAVEHVTLRTFRPDDLPSLREIDREFQAEVGFGTPERPFFDHPDYDNVDAIYLRDGGAFWVIEGADGEVVAFGGVLRIDEETARLRRFRVRTSWRRQGLATRLLEEAERFCAERGYRHVTLGTGEVQQAAQALYRKHGYVEAGERWFGGEWREIEFAKELA